jgi:hypothetical protein
MAVFVVAMILSSITALIGFTLYLIFCAFIVVRTGGTAGLRDVAVAVRAFASVWSPGSRSRLRSIFSPAPLEPDEPAESDHDGPG